MSTELAVREAGAVEVSAESRAMMAMLERMATDPSVDASKLRELWALKQEIDAQRRKELFFESLARVQAKVPRIEQRGLMDRGGGGKIPYAKREDIDREIRPLYIAEGFSVTWDSPTTDDAGLIHVQGRFTCHGHTEMRSWTCKPDPSGGKTGPQAVSSTVAYGKRQVSKMFWDVIEEGQDVNGADPCISQKDADSLRDAITDAGIEMGRFLKMAGVASIESLPASKLDKAWQRVNEKRSSK